MMISKILRKKLEMRLPDNKAINELSMIEFSHQAKNI